MENMMNCGIVDPQMHSELKVKLAEKEALMDILHDLKHKVMEANMGVESCWDKIKNDIIKNFTPPEGKEFGGISINKNTNEIHVSLRNINTDDDDDGPTERVLSTLLGAMGGH